MSVFLLVFCYQTSHIASHFAAEPHTRSTGKFTSVRESTSTRSSKQDVIENLPASTINGSARVLNSSIPTSEEIARDIQSMEKQARLQLERRKRAALFAAKLQQSKLRKLEQETNRSTSSTSSSTLSLPSAATAVPPPPPSSVPAAVAHAVVAQLKSQRERTIEAAAAAAADLGKLKVLSCFTIPLL